MIYDTFIFFNELDLLEIRLNELSDVIDYFVIIEAVKTHQNNSKPLYFLENKHKFSKFLPKIKHLVVKDFPVLSNSKEIEAFQRNATSIALKNCNEDDAIIISDVDEIPNPKAIRESLTRPGLKELNQKFYYYFINCLCTSEEWRAVKILPYSDYVKYPSPDYIRNKSVADYTIENGGWHFSYLGGVEKIIEKLESFYHGNLNKEEYKNPDKILRALDNGEDLFGRSDFKLKIMELDGTYPEYILNNLDKFDKYIKDTNKSYSVKKLNTGVVKIDLGCGSKKEPGFFGIDIKPFDCVDMVADLSTGIPLPDNYADYIKAYDFIEHIQDKIKIMNEIWRVLKPGGVADIMVPSTDGRAAFQDPTHISFWNENSFHYYLNEDEDSVHTKYSRSIGINTKFKVKELFTTELTQDRLCWVKAVLEADKSFFLSQESP